MRQAWGEQELYIKDPYAKSVMEERFGKLTLNKVRAVKIMLNNDKRPLDHLFVGSDKLTSFTEIQHFTRLEQMRSTFYNCPNLGGTLTIPASVYYIGGACFFNTQLMGIEFLAQTFKWGHGMIWKCPKLEWVKIHAVEVPQKFTPNNQYMFDFAIPHKTWKLYVPDGSVDKYRTDHNFANLGERIRPMSEFKE